MTVEFDQPTADEASAAGNEPRTEDRLRTARRVREVYERVAAEYDARIPGQTALDDCFAEKERAFVLDRIRESDTVLDMGCGTGRFTVPIARQAKRTIGLDISDAMLERAASNAEAAEVTVDLRQGVMEEIPLADESVDVVVSMLALMHIDPDNRTQVFLEVQRVLKPGGRMLLGVKNSAFERMSPADRFAQVDITDLENKELVFTQLRNGDELRAPWHSFSLEELKTLFALTGLRLTDVHGNIPLLAWLPTGQDPESGLFVLLRELESVLSNVPPFNHLGYHLLVEAVKPLVHG